MPTHCSECTWLLTTEKFAGLQCPEMLGSSKSAQHMNPLLFSHSVLALWGSFPLLPLQCQQSSIPQTPFSDCCFLAQWYCILIFCKGLRAPNMCELDELGCMYN